MVQQKVSAQRPDRRALAVLLTLLLVGGVGAGIALLPDYLQQLMAPASGLQRDQTEHAKAARLAEITQRFQQGVMMLHSRQYQHAVTAFHRVLELDPQLPEAHVNLGYAMLGLERYEVARSFFESATALRPMQANAYYGMALAYAELHDAPAAIGAMRTYLHLAKADDPFLEKARATLALWERSGKSEKLPKIGKAAPAK